YKLKGSNGGHQAAVDGGHELRGVVQPGIDLFLGLLLAVAVALLQSAGELLALAFNDVEIVIGELAPLLLNLAFELVPVSFHTIPIHFLLLLLFRTDRMSGKPRRRSNGSAPCRVAATRSTAATIGPKTRPKKLGA